MRFSYVDSPLGELLVTRDESGIAGLYLPTGRNPVTARPEWTRDDAAFDDVRAQLDEYFAGTRREFDLPLHPTGTGFQKRVWDALLEIPYGQTASYGTTAAAIGAPTAARAVGLANGQNPISIVVPCHRVVGANGSLTGYGGGLDAKRWLLSHEAAHAGLFA
ncbi:MAG: methylated-DNA--[protein]-cysteine S-methyltransferase [Jatrophihabitantaceae bacterium]